MSSKQSSSNQSSYHYSDCGSYDRSGTNSQASLHLVTDIRSGSLHLPLTRVTTTARATVQTAQTATTTTTPMEALTPNGAMVQQHIHRLRVIATNLLVESDLFYFSHV
ncbi:hypothetical protein FRC15_005243 [Serendipita sp. 397]|nr:hypothetical protein FRC15_005243 [Serendipita sp. 397]KAG8838502.1 hypothetical protein FRC18_004134 [Serendipita sp. 400]